MVGGDAARILLVRTRDKAEKSDNGISGQTHTSTVDLHPASHYEWQADKTPDHVTYTRDAYAHKEHPAKFHLRQT